MNCAALLCSPPAGHLVVGSNTMKKTLIHRNCIRLIAMAVCHLIVTAFIGGVLFGMRFMGPGSMGPPKPTLTADILAGIYAAFSFPLLTVFGDSRFSLLILNSILFALSITVLRSLIAGKDKPTCPCT